MIQTYSTLSRKKQELKLKTGKKLRVFVCGITTYDFSHIGHARTYIAFDMAVKYLRQKGYNVFYLQNVTDIDDKVIKRANEQNEDVIKLSRRFEKEYMADMKSLGVNAVSQYARATSCIKEIISQVERLLKKGFAYEIAGDGMYFDILKFKDYGKLSGRTTEQAQDAVSRIDESVKKRNKGDFALWKFVSESEKKAGVPFWKSPWGEGRPGWHIEDTAITEKFFGAQYDIHGGARDLIFPHHEAEITQMESVSGRKPLVNYWMHTGFLTVQGEKMSKSLGNFITIRDFLENHSPRLLRFFVLKTHYRSPIDYSTKLLDQAEKELERIDEFAERLKFQSSNLKTQSNSKLKKLKGSFESAMADDLNTPLAVSILFELIREGNMLLDKEKLSKDDAKEILIFLKQIDEYFGFIFWGREKQTVPTEIKKLAEQREQYRKAKNWPKSDELRDQLLARGWIVEDTSSGYKFKSAY
jgi:cysteinyl-tRNA synthetase